MENLASCRLRCGHAVWGVNARTLEAMQQWGFDLKWIKSKIFLLGEDKATWPSSFEKRFDAAYDW